jgi:pyruvate/2-oxoglutarate dehydrogenase complex dihydrolipoamide acyltransferase (E2) component
VDETGNIIETTLDESGELLDEDITGSVTDLPAAEGYEEETNEEGQTTRVVEDESGSLIHLQLGPDGSILDLEIPDLGDTVETVTETAENTVQQVTGGGQEGGDEGQEGGEEGQEGGEEEPNATEAAKQKAEELGVDLSQMEGSGADGRITVKDVVSAGGQG